MKNYNKTIPAVAKLNLLRQICNFIPDFLVPKLARATGVQEKARTFSPWSHLIALMYAQLTHSIGLNDVCDALGLHEGVGSHCLYCLLHTIITHSACNQ